MVIIGCICKNIDKKVDISQWGESLVKEKELVKYILYFFSYILIYPCCYSFIATLVLSVGANISAHKAHLLDSIFWIITTTVGTWILNTIFKRKIKLKKNNIYSGLIVISHLILIPSSPYLLWLLTR
ncbi:hypothetical protein [Bacillus toyonensis]|uniref:hypothetical protein n=1 Tax=Bacillus toyonensis TaxID=155322 RepID=UPI00301A331E